MKLLTIVGARPQFIKASVLSRAIRNRNNAGRAEIEDIVLHTGQHFDRNMSDVFFDELKMPNPKYNLGVNGGMHGQMTGRMLEGIESVLSIEKPDWVVVYGDTNSTLAGALAAAKLHIPVAHVEAGLRSFNRSMPEEINRVLTDHASEILFCPTKQSVINLQEEGIKKGVFMIGDVMYDSFLYLKNEMDISSKSVSTCLRDKKHDFILATCHRSENTDSLRNLRSIFEGLSDLAQAIDVTIPLHPRTKTKLEEFGLMPLLSSLNVIEPVGYKSLIKLLLDAKCVVTDSGGLQKEAYFAQKPCITIRRETEWTETLNGDRNVLVGSDKEKLVKQVNDSITRFFDVWDLPYGDGKSGEAIVKTLASLT